MVKPQFSFIIILFIFLSQISFGQVDSVDFYTKSMKAMQANDTIALKEYLQKWEKKDPLSPELITTKFNYYILLSRKEVMQLVTDEPSGEYLEISDSTGEIAGYMTSIITYDTQYLEKGFAVLDTGIQQYPDRLDIWFGKIHMLGQIEEWGRFTSQILKLIDQSIINNNKWKWTKGSNEYEGEDFLLGGIQDYQSSLYETGDDSLLINMRKIAKKILTIYPEHVPSLSNLSITYLLLGETEKAISPLLKAEAIDPNDPIVLSNIAQAYIMLENKKMAIEYYNKTIAASDNQGTISYCKQKIEELKK